MQKIYKKCVLVSLRNILVATLICTTVPIHAGVIDRSPPIHYYQSSEDLMQRYEDLMQEFDVVSEIEQQEMDAQIAAGVLSREFFLKRWTRKTKEWFVKKTTKVLLKMAGLKHVKNGEDLAYRLAKLKRKIDKKLYNTGCIEKIFSKMSEEAKGLDAAHLETIQSRIRYYYKHPKRKPSVHIRDDVKCIPVKSLLGGVEIFCGALVCVLPFPGAAILGVAIIGSGVAHVLDGLVNKIEEDEKKLVKKSRIGRAKVCGGIEVIC